MAGDLRGKLGFGGTEGGARALAVGRREDAARRLNFGAKNLGGCGVWEALTEGRGSEAEIRFDVSHREREATCTREALDDNILMRRRRLGTSERSRCLGGVSVCLSWKQLGALKEKRPILPQQA